MRYGSCPHFLVEGQGHFPAEPLSPAVIYFAFLFYNPSNLIGKN